MPKVEEKFSKENVELRINLDEVFGGEVPDDAALRGQIGQEVIDTIVNRTLENKDVNGKGFEEYDEDYTETLEFKAFGKDENDVNLKQTGDMLGLMDIIAEGRDYITIGWRDDLQQKKAANHTQGVTLPKRDFFGLSSSEIKEIRSKFRDRVQIKREEPGQTAGEIMLLSEIRRLLGGN